MFDFAVVTHWIDQFLRNYLSEWGTVLIEGILIGLVILVAYAIIALALILAERKVCAAFQCRLGPNRVGPWGLIQTVADMVKILTKEIMEIKHVDHFLYNLAPFMVIIASVLTFGCIPFAKGLHAIDF
ncbi:MAG: NADH-quinone oxidoreductase subunit H, partial [Bacteroidales bacterium]